MALPPLYKKILKALQKDHPNTPYKTLQKRASKKYHAINGTKPPTKKKTTTKKRTTTTKKKAVTKKKKYYGKTKRPYLRGAAWTIDHYSHNKREKYEKPNSKRKVKTRYN